MVANAKQPRRVSVLIVDDDPEMRELFATTIEQAGYSVAIAEDGREAIECLETLRPELIFLDVCMPTMSGAEFRQQQRRNKEWLRIPTIVMTGANEEPMLDIAVEDTLRKPISADVLLSIVKRHCT